MTGSVGIACAPFEDRVEVIEGAAAIRPVRVADLPALGGFFEELSIESRFLRFFAPVRPTGSLLRRLSGGHANVDVLVAVADGVIVGHAMATDRLQAQTFEDRCPARVTDVGVVVADAWQRRGVGAALMRALVARARARGVPTLAMDVLPSNGRVLAMIIGHWPEAVIGQTADSLEIRIPLPRLAPVQDQVALGEEPGTIDLYEDAEVAQCGDHDLAFTVGR
jgi:GNAT superfamily N-acetyltransferase